MILEIKAKIGDEIFDIDLNDSRDWDYILRVIPPGGSAAGNFCPHVLIKPFDRFGGKNNTVEPIVPTGDFFDNYRNIIPALNNIQRTPTFRNSTTRVREEI